MRNHATDRHLILRKRKFRLLNREAHQDIGRRHGDLKCVLD
jgi:hypothetical protein